MPVANVKYKQNTQMSQTMRRVNSEDLDQSALTYRLIRAFAVSIL